MPSIVQFSAPRLVELVECEQQELTPGTVRIRTWYSGISAGTELTAYRGSNPYLSKSWDVAQRLFTEGAPAFSYPVVGWGYSEVGEVVEAADDVVGLAVGEVVYGIWGHRSDAVVPATAVMGRQVPDGTEPLHGIFARVGAIALNAVLGANLHLGEDVAVFGQGVIGLLATRLANLSGANVVAIDHFGVRLETAKAMGAHDVVASNVAGGAAESIRSLTNGRGVDVAIELSGNYRALHEAVRSVGADGRVIAAGFYQGGGAHLSLGEEFHHNRVQIVASQIGGTPVGLGTRWTPARLVSVFMDQLSAGRIEVAPLISDIVDAQQVAQAFRRLDEGAPQTMQTVLRFEGAPA
ncbi:zinc-binding alcohol dehydrogenase [uncultured Arthrobacter sp.]|uniref:zinc-dependent alcohol dehydrogenase n=1 Tax=uncultured Arthrobacter sp. TaxID=114050 RepID=UPI00262210D1|nr:zinc-binding alcohol dehydrogenase [uncultured Arthrobacter sp.]